jgi:hypothetical protein
MLVPVLLMLASGCDGKDDGDDLNGAVLAKEPATVTECGEGPHPAISSGSTGFAMAEVTMHWLAGTHSLGSSATLYLCQVQPTVGTVKLAPSPGVQVSPNSLSFNGAGDALLKIVVTVDSSANSGASVTLAADLTGSGFAGPLNGPTIQIADGRWSFDLPGATSDDAAARSDSSTQDVRLLGVLVCILGAAGFVAGTARSSGRGVAAAVVVFLLGFALVLVGFRTRPPPTPLCDREPQARECGV